MLRHFVCPGAVAGVLLLAACHAGEGRSSGPALESQQQALKLCGLTVCSLVSDAYFCSQNAANCDAVGTSNHCCLCDRTFACGTDCQACQATNVTSNPCNNATQTAALACRPVCTSSGGGFANRDGNGANGCEPCDVPDYCGSDCGTCGSYPNSSRTCSSNSQASSSACGFDCDPGYADLNAGDGCESACDTPTACGSDCGVCATRDHSAPTCAGIGAPAATSCGIDCDPGYLDVSGGTENGCETACSSLTACGSDCQPCAPRDHTLATCTGNTAPAATACVYTCLAGYLDLNSLPSDGCEASCDVPGRCGTDCLACNSADHATTTCADNTQPASSSCGFVCDSGFHNYNGIASDGCEAPCSVVGACGTDCAACVTPDHASPSCSGNTEPSSTACSFTCSAGYRNVNGQAADGCETACSAPTLCGTDCAACSVPPNSTATCSGNTQSSSLACSYNCLAGYRDSNGQAFDGCETSCVLVSACGTDCATCPTRAHATRACADNTHPSGVSCTFICNSGYRDGNGLASDGCEATCSIASACGSDCAACPSRANATSTCASYTQPSSSACGYTCLAGYRDTNTQATDGCEATCNQSTLCGTDCASCPVRAHSTPTCAGNSQASSVSCGYSCASGYKDTNGQATDGCETTCNLATACGTDCTACPVPPHTIPSCSGNTQASSLACSFTCQAGYLDSNGLAADGCEVACDQPDRCGNNCGTCPTRPNASRSCSGNAVPSAQACGFVCNDGYRDGNLLAFDGCEATCSAPAACGLECQACPARAHATLSCASHLQPAASACLFTCTAGYLDSNGVAADGCDEACHEPDSCGNDCLACAARPHSSRTCSGNALAAAQACGISCDPGFRNLSGGIIDGCETSCSTPTLCGSDCLACTPRPNSSSTCAGNGQVSASSCGFVCTPGFDNVDGQTNNGCEGACNLATRCGTNCQACPVPTNADATCAGNTVASSQACGYTCKAGYLDPNGRPDNGCEAACDTVATCGSDCRACAARSNSTVSCTSNLQPSAQACVYQCRPGFHDSDGLPNGCEEACILPTLCGTNCQSCPPRANATSTCSGNTQLADAACGYRCNSGFNDTDSQPLTGCEQACTVPGLCGTDCRSCPARPNATPTCAGNQTASAQSCGFRCNEGYFDSDHLASTGCDHPCDVPTHCGKDCQPCPPRPNADATCANNLMPADQACGYRCRLGYTDTDAVAFNGCETACDSPSLCGNDCRPCPLRPNADTICAGNTVGPASQACGYSCLPGWFDKDQTADNGCELRCETLEHCGKDCQACPPRPNATLTCADATTPAAESCGYECDDGWFDSNGLAEDGCEARCDRPDHCGSNCRPCPTPPNTLPVCQGALEPASTSCSYQCLPGFFDDNGTVSGGCEVVCNTSTHCGSDCAACQAAPHADPVCADNVRLAEVSCGLRCQSGWAEVDPFQEGCETECSQPQRCGSDCRACPDAPHSQPVCFRGSTPEASFCGVACEAGYVDDNLRSDDGCEACAGGYYDPTASQPVESCEPCEVDQHCGITGPGYCLDCTRELINGRVCLGGRCACEDAEDCPAGSDCLHHACVVHCEDDGDCPNAQRCCGPAGEKACLAPGKEACDGKDNDCNQAIDDGLKPEDAPLCGSQEGVCTGARRVCSDGLHLPCVDAIYSAHSPDWEKVETRCDGKDNDCNGEIDEPLSCRETPDAGASDTGLPPTGPDASVASFTGETYNLGGCGCQQAATPGTLAALALLVAGLGGRWRRRRS